MSAKEIERAALADPDAQPLSESDLRTLPRIPQAKIIRRALRLTQEEFAPRYRIPLGTLRDREQGRAKPDQPTQAYLTLIARDPECVDRMLNRTRPGNHGKRHSVLIALINRRRPSSIANESGSLV